MDIKTAKLYIQLSKYKYLLNKTENFIKWALENVKNPYVACSFGKDSSVMLDIILKHNPTIPVRFVSHPETNLLDNYEEVIKKWVKDKNINLQVINLDMGLLKETSPARLGMDNPFESWDSFFVGIRMQESIARRITIKSYGKFYKLKYNNKIRISPLADWTATDIAAYILTNNIPVLNKYKVEGFKARTTSGVPREFIGETLKSLKMRDTVAFNKMLILYPDVKYYV